MKKFNAYQYIQKNYIQDGRNAVIPLSVKKVEDFYHPFDPKQETLKEEVINYIDNIANVIPLECQITLEIKTKQMTKEEEQKVKEAFKAHYGLRLQTASITVKANYIKVLWLAILGLLIMIFYYYFYLKTFHGSNPWVEILDIVGWVSWWEAIDIFLFENSKSKAEKLNMKQLYDAKVSFVFE